MDSKTDTWLAMCELILHNGSSLACLGSVVVFQSADSQHNRKEIHEKPTNSMAFREYRHISSGIQRANNKLTISVFLSGDHKNVADQLRAAALGTPFSLGEAKQWMH